VNANLIPYGAEQGYLASIHVELECGIEDRLRVNFVASGNVERLKIPPPVVPQRTDRLWEHTCFEVFLRQDESANYYEFNFSPSGEWAAYVFSAYRVGIPFNYHSAPQLIVQRNASALELAAAIDLKPLLLEPGKSLRLGLSALIEAADGGISYWALKHPAPKPDFHHPDSLALPLSFPGDPLGKRLQ
jgi:hypothetical protein